MSRTSANCKILILLFALLPILLFCSSPEEKARKLYNNAITLEQKGDYIEALSIYEEIIEDYPQTETSLEVNKRLPLIRVQVHDIKTEPYVMLTTLIFHVKHYAKKHPEWAMDVNGELAEDAASDDEYDDWIDFFFEGLFEDIWDNYAASYDSSSHVLIARSVDNKNDSLSYDLDTGRWSSTGKLKKICEEIQRYTEQSKCFYCEGKGKDYDGERCVMCGGSGELYLFSALSG